MHLSIVAALLPWAMEWIRGNHPKSAIISLGDSATCKITHATTFLFNRFGSPGSGPGADGM